MSITFTSPQLTEMKPRIVVMGVGGAGGNAVNNMIRAGLDGVDFVVANTDAQALSHSEADQRIQLGLGITEGLGAGARPEIGCASAEEAIPEIEQMLRSCHMAFIAAGMGGGTGTGAAPVIAKSAKEMGILTVGIVTKPFQFEGSKRMLIAERGIEELQRYVDTLIVIPNQNLFRVANEKTTFADAFAMADQVLDSGVRGITDLMVNPGIINLDFADVKTVMGEMGKAMMGTGSASGERRAIEAAEAAISNPLLDDVSMRGARGVLINITGGADLTLFEVDEAANRIRSEVAQDANIIVGSTFEKELDGELRVSVVATGIQLEEGASPKLTVVGGADALGDQDGASDDVIEEEDQALPGFEVADEAEPIDTPVPSRLAELGPSFGAQAPISNAYAIEPIADPELSAELIAEEDIFEVPDLDSAEAEPDIDFDAHGIDAPAVNSEITAHAELEAAAPMEAQTEPATATRGPSLWQRITGQRKSRRTQDRGVLGRGDLIEPTIEALESDEQLSMFGDSSPRSEPDMNASATQSQEQSEIGGIVTSADRLTVPHNEERHLEIPAFLRRQAN